MKLLLLILSSFFVNSLLAQPSNDNCSNATTLCGEQTILASSAGATVSACAGCSDGSSVAGNFCFSLENTTWFSFLTNENGGNALVSFSNINCNADPIFGNQIDAVVLSASTTCDESSYTAVSNCASGESSDFSITATGLSPNTTYYILVDGTINGIGATSPSECSFNVNVSGEAVKYDVGAGSDVQVEIGESTTLQGLGPTGSEWSPPNGLSTTTSFSPTASPEETTTYFLTYVSDNGCTYIDDVIVAVYEPITVPNTITPNDDGFNDSWLIGRIDNYPGAEVSVFDRWGQKVFNVVGYTNSRRWDGSHKGKRLPSGTYFYSIDLKTGNKKNIFVGPITIIH